ncbi:RNA-directed DNA polymerase, eukaryota, reverse transcriptase zinc-binding domain protein [Tanacetum coccineum]
MQDFRDCINAIEIEVIGCSGFFYTWTKSLRNANNNVLKKLDRIMVSERFHKEFAGIHAIFQLIAGRLMLIAAVLESMIKDVEKLLAQKVRIDWLNEDDKNSAFYHKVIKGRRSRNRVDTICDDLFCNTLTHEEDDFMDNIMLSKEILRGYDRKNGPKRCTRKIDLRKAYDTINWEFLETILKKFGFLNKMGGRGLRQGDPMSPYIFTLVMEVLNLLLQRRIRNNNGFKYHYGCKEIKLVNLCFADDLITFCNGDSLSARVIKEALQEFSVVLGLFPNLIKSTLYFGSLIEAEKDQIRSIIQFREGSLRTKRLMLIAYVLESMSMYWASVFKLPKSVIKEINGILKRFLWSNWDPGRGKCLLEVRDKIASRLQYEVRNGRQIQMWSDRWHNSGLLIEKITYKDLYDARMPRMIKLADMINEGKWKWPSEWRNNDLEVMKIQVPKLKNDVKDIVKRKGNNDELVPLSNRLLTQDKIMAWGTKTGLLCSLCKKVNDSHDHLFFLCDCSKDVWNRLAPMMNMTRTVYKWDEVERNQRIFRGENRDPETLFKAINEVINLKIMNIRVRNSAEVRKVAELWDIQFVSYAMENSNNLEFFWVVFSFDYNILYSLALGGTIWVLLSIWIGRVSHGYEELGPIFTLSKEDRMDSVEGVNKFLPGVWDRLRGNSFQHCQRYADEHVPSFSEIIMF